MSDGFVPLGTLKPGDLFETREGQLGGKNGSNDGSDCWVEYIGPGHGGYWENHDTPVRPLVAVYRHPQLSPDLYALLAGVMADPSDGALAALVDYAAECLGVQGDAARSMQARCVRMLQNWQELAAEFGDPSSRDARLLQAFTRRIRELPLAAATVATADHTEGG